MKPFSYSTARRIVATFNETRCVRETARVLKLPLASVRSAADFLWNCTFHKETAIIARTSEPSRIKISEEFWCEYLYTSNVTPEAAAESLGWPLRRVLASCKGATEWRKKSGRKRLYVRGCVNTQPQKDDPSEEEVLAAAAEIRKTWAPTDARHGERQPPVEAREYVFDGHDQQVFRVS